jgi:hypothetical protein
VDGLLGCYFGSWHPAKIGEDRSKFLWLLRHNTGLTALSWWISPFFLGVPLPLIAGAKKMIARRIESCWVMLAGYTKPQTPRIARDLIDLARDFCSVAAIYRLWGQRCVLDSASLFYPQFF